MRGGKYDALAAKCVQDAKMGAGIVILFGIENNRLTGDFGVALSDPYAISPMPIMLRALANGFIKLNKMAAKHNRAIKKRKTKRGKR